MTRVFENAQAGGGTRLLIIGASAYPHARDQKLRVPKLNPISSASLSAMEIARRAIKDWANQFSKPLASVDLLVDTPEAPGGAIFTSPDGTDHQLNAPTMANVKVAKGAWLSGVGPDDMLVFYCCGHGIWLPARGRTFLASSFGEDEDNPWADAIALDDFAFGLSEFAPRQQWLIFDCCNNTPPEALKSMGATANPLVQSLEGQRKLMETAHGLLSQVTVSSSSPGAQSFGKDGRSSRFMEAFLEACEGAGCRRQTDGKWWVDQQGIEEAIATYRLRVAPVEEEEYFLFPRLTQTDAADVPRLLWHTDKPLCTLLVRSLPAYRLKQGSLTIKCRATDEKVGEQKAGADAAARYRLKVKPWLDYDLKAVFENGEIDKETFAIPPLAETLF